MRSRRSPYRRTTGDRRCLSRRRRQTVGPQRRGHAERAAASAPRPGRLSDGRPRRPRRSLRRLRAAPVCLQLLSQSPLPQVPSFGPRTMARCAASRIARRAVFSRGVHAASRAEAVGICESANRLPYLVPSSFRNAVADCRTTAPPGAKIGFLAVLHTWGQNLIYHPHLHCVVPAGGFSADGQQWIQVRATFSSRCAF